MTIVELYRKYVETDYSKEAVYSLFDESFVCGRQPIGKTLEIVQSSLQRCVYEDNDRKYIEMALGEIALEVAKVYALTNLDVPSEGDEKIEDKNTYDLMFEMGLVDYLYEKMPRVCDEFDRICVCEINTFENRNGIQATIHKFFKDVSSVFSDLSAKAGKILDNVENFDPKQLEEARSVLLNMNESVEKIKELNFVE